MRAPGECEPAAGHQRRRQVPQPRPDAEIGRAPEDVDGGEVERHQKVVAAPRRVARAGRAGLAFFLGTAAELTMRT
jgi:hypothetical protein